MQTHLNGRDDMRDPREEAVRPLVAPLQLPGAARHQRVVPTDAHLRHHLAADHRRGKRAKMASQGSAWHTKKKLDLIFLGKLLGRRAELGSNNAIDEQNQIRSDHLALPC